MLFSKTAASTGYPGPNPDANTCGYASGTTGITADGVILRLIDERAYRCQYLVECDPTWKVSRVLIQDLDGSHSLELVADGNGHWAGANGNRLDALEGCLDVDISATPFTNTLPIRRLGLSPGTGRNLTVAYIKLPEMTVRPVAQRYACVGAGAEGGVYRYDDLFWNFSAELPVEADGLVLDYPETFRRVWPQPGGGCL